MTLSLNFYLIYPGNVLGMTWQAPDPRHFSTKTFRSCPNPAPFSPTNLHRWWRQRPRYVRWLWTSDVWCFYQENRNSGFLL